MLCMLLFGEFCDGLQSQRWQQTKLFELLINKNEYDEPLIFNLMGENCNGLQKDKVKSLSCVCVRRLFQIKAHSALRKKVNCIALRNILLIRDEHLDWQSDEHLGWPCDKHLSWLLKPSFYFDRWPQNCGEMMVGLFSPGRQNVVHKMGS